jgi:hypothetical protein
VAFTKIAGAGIDTTGNVVISNLNVSGIVTASSFVGNLTGTATSTTNIPNLTGDITSNGTVTSIASGVIVDADINASAAIADTKLATISTAGKVSNTATTATNLNTASAIVARDGSGNFSAGTITANLTGTASTTSFATTSFGLSGSPSISVTEVNASGISTFTNGPILIGSGTSTGTASQRLQVTGSAYVSGNLGIGTTNPAEKLEVTGKFRLFDGGYPYIDIGVSTSNYFRLLHDNPNDRFYIGKNNNTTLVITGANNVEPGTDNAYNLGSSTKRWANIYSADIQLSNEGSSNDVDGTWGQYTIQEGENDLFLINRRNGKKYKFVLQEVN